jgi:hypothetical protein
LQFLQKHHNGFSFKLLKGFKYFDDTNMDISIDRTLEPNHHFIINANKQNRFSVWDMKRVVSKSDKKTGMVVKVEVIVDIKTRRNRTTSRMHPAAAGIEQHISRTTVEPVLNTIIIQITHKDAPVSARVGGKARKAARAPKKA